VEREKGRYRASERPKENRAPDIDAHARPSVVPVGEPVLLDGAAADSDGLVTEVQWEVRAKLTTSSIQRRGGESVFVRVTEPGSYCATATVKDELGAVTRRSVTFQAVAKTR
jgi:hypothetical protein